jgi:AmiR/NasT family two-component response regulator
MPTTGNGYSDRVAQASGMVSIQANCTIAEALELMRSLAFDTDSTLDEVATLIIEREIRLGD